MPSNLLNADVGFPQLNEEQSNDEKINKIVDYLYMLLEQLRYSFGNMDKDNFSESGLDELEHLITDPVYVRLEDDEGNIAALAVTAQGLTTRITNAEGDISTLTQTANSLTSRITNAEGDISTLTQTVNSITLSVSNGTDSSTITLWKDGVAVTSKIITFSGVVTFTDLSTAGSTVINGANISTGTISAITISGCTITGGDINGAKFHNASGNASLELGDISGGYGDMKLYGYNRDTLQKWEVFRVYDQVGSADMYIYQHLFLTGSGSGVTAHGSWNFYSAKLKVRYGYSLPYSGETGEVFFLL